MPTPPTTIKELEEQKIAEFDEKFTPQDFDFSADNTQIKSFLSSLITATVEMCEREVTPEAKPHTKCAGCCRCPYCNHENTGFNSCRQQVKDGFTRLMEVGWGKETSKK